MRALVLLGVHLAGCGRIGFAADDPAIVAVQETTNSSTGAEISILFGAGIQSDDTVVVCFTYSGNAALETITDSLANQYSVIGPVTSNGFVHYIAVAHAAAGGSDSVTITLSAAPKAQWNLLAIEYAGLGQNPYDGDTYDSGTGTAMMTGNVSVSSSHELLLAYAHSTGPEVGSDFTLRERASDSIVEDKVVFAPGNYSAAGVTTDGIWTLILATFNGR